MSGQLFEEWAEKADEDYRAAMALETSDVPSVVCFLSQQCIEKYLKAALLKHGRKPTRTHDLIELNETLEKLDEGYSGFVDALQVLLPYSVLIRYPGSPVSAEEAEKARGRMQELRLKIRKLLNLEAKG